MFEVSWTEESSAVRVAARFISSILSKVKIMLLWLSRVFIANLIKWREMQQTEAEMHGHGQHASKILFRAVFAMKVNETRFFYFLVLTDTSDIQEVCERRVWVRLFTQDGTYHILATLYGNKF